MPPYTIRQIKGDVAQLVEQRTENPCVGGSIPSITTSFKNHPFFILSTNLRSILTYLVKNYHLLYHLFFALLSP